MHSVGIICLERCVKRCEVMVNLSLVYLFAATLFENNNVFYICMYIICLMRLSVRVQCLPIFRQIFVTKFVSLENLAPFRRNVCAEQNLYGV